MKKKTLLLLLCGIMAASPISVLAGSQKDAKQEQENVSNTNLLSDYTLDELQNLYLAINPDITYSDALQLVKDSGLFYSEEKYNGSRELQVAFTDECTAQKYKKESGDYLQISFDYPSGENSSNDDLSKYTLSTCIYCPETGPTLISLSSGHYFSYSEPGNYIDDYENKDEVAGLPETITKEEQLVYYFNHCK